MFDPLMNVKSIHLFSWSRVCLHSVLLLLFFSALASQVTAEEKLDLTSKLENSPLQTEPLQLKSEPGWLARKKVFPQPASRTQMLDLESKQRVIPFRVSQRESYETKQVPPPKVNPFQFQQNPSDLFDSKHVRLPLLPQLSKGLGTPQKSAKALKKYQKYIQTEVDPEITKYLIVGRPKIVKFKQVPNRFYIPNEDVVSIQAIDQKQWVLIGLKEGTTVLNLWLPDPKNPNQEEILSILISVIPDPERGSRREAVYKALEKEINRNFPDSVVYLSLVGDKLLVKGQAKDIEEATQILRIIGSAAPGGPETVPLENFNLNVFTSPDSDGQFPEGQLENLLLRSTAEGEADQANSSVINMLHIPGVQQVMLKVVVAEVNRSALRAIGAQVSIGDSNGAASFLNLFQQSLTASGGSFIVNRGDFDLTINALRTVNLAKSLAEPVLTTLNGRPAQFQAGGQFPVPQITGFTGAGLQGVQFVPFGVQLQFLPLITDKDRIRLNLSAAVSTRDESIGSNIGGTGSNGQNNVAGLNTRNFQTTVELREGQTLAVAGLIQNNFGADSSRVPLAGDVPGLGRLFSNDNTSADEQELIVLVTPMLVQPLAEEEQYALPGSDMFEPDDIEFFLHGKIEGCRSEDYRSQVRTDCERMKAFRSCQQQFIIGRSGYSTQIIK